MTRALITISAALALGVLPTLAGAQSFKLGGSPPKLPPPTTAPAAAPTTAPAVATDNASPAAPAAPTVSDTTPKPNPPPEPAKPDNPGDFAPLPARKPMPPMPPIPALKPEPLAPTRGVAPAAPPPPQPAAAAAPEPEFAFTLAEFPPGLFTDGNAYRLNDLRGKAIVLFFFDPADPRMQATVPQRNALVRKFRDKPVVFFGVTADTLHGARSAATELGLAMPVFADTLGILHIRYRATLTATRTWHTVVIDGAGKIAHEELTEASLTKAVESAHWRFRDRHPYEPRLGPALDAIEAGNYEQGARLAANLAYAGDRKVADAAKQFQQMLRGDADGWKSDADRLAPTDPLAAYDLYARVAASCPGTDIAKAVGERMKKLGAKPAVRNELAARSMYASLGAAVCRDERVEKWDAADYCEEIIRAYPGTPTADKLVTYLDDLGKAKVRFTPRTKRGSARL